MYVGFIALMGLVTPLAAVPAAQADDTTYHLPLMRTWTQTTLDVLIIPAVPYYDHGTVVNDASLTNAAKNAVTTWKAAIDDHGSSDLAGVIEFNVVVAGPDLLSSEAMTYDIIVGNMRWTAPWGPFGGAATGVVEPCLILNTPPPMGGWTFKIALHEFGHCLGLGHPTDFEPDEDVMAYGNGICVSNLDLLGLHESFGPAFGRTPANGADVEAVDYEVYC